MAEGVGTRDIHLGKVVLYQLSYSRFIELYYLYLMKWYPGPDLNRHAVTSEGF